MKQQLKVLVHTLLYYEWVRRSVEAIPYVERILPPWQRTHPFDRKFGTHTSGFVPVQLIVSDRTLREKIKPYGSSQPSIIRSAIRALGDINLEEYNFVDLGCGKGRVMVVASEFPFRSISGVELSSHLAKIARRNMARVRRNFPRRPPARVFEENAATFAFPEGKLVLFFYHSFGEEILRQVVRNLEALVASGSGPVFFLSSHPEQSDVVDSSPSFTRWWAGTLFCDKGEVGFGPGTSDPVMIWRSVEAGR
jgi:SAM-dependent methyltransferase